MERILEPSTGKTYLRAPSGTCYHADTPEGVIHALERIKADGERVRVFFGDPTTGEAWAEENDVAGYIGRSTGSIKIPLLVHNGRSMGGGALLSNCIVGIKSKWGWRYRHPNFTAGRWTVLADNTHPEYSAAAWHNGQLHARFKTLKQAERYAAFMQGERLCK